MTTSKATQDIILHWGEMGTRWGINRTVAQIQALLFLSPEPLNAEDITKTLGVARSNVSNSLKELMNWGIVTTTHRMGDRRDYFVCEKDPWEMFRIILEERKKREIDPTVAALRKALVQARDDHGQGHYTTERIQTFLDFFETSVSWYEHINRLPKKALVKLMKMGGQLKALLRKGD